MNKYTDATPGPWREYTDPDGWTWVVGPDMEHYTDLKGNYTGLSNTICSIGDMEVTDKTDHANAALIAAAPDLLDENKRLRAALEDAKDVIAYLDAGVLGMEWLVERKAQTGKDGDSE